jgi:hypothetical protein
MALEGWYVKKVQRSDIEGFIMANHYSGTIRSCFVDYCYGLFDECDKMKGAMFFGAMAMHNQFMRFADKEEDVIELRRLCCVDDTPKNAESFFIGKSIKLLAEEWRGKVIVSYADKEYSHSGIIYKASNFECWGEGPGAKVIYVGTKKYHDKIIRARKPNGELTKVAIRIKAMLETGEAVWKDTAGKVTYVYKLNPKRVFKNETLLESMEKARKRKEYEDKRSVQLLSMRRKRNE